MKSRSNNSNKAKKQLSEANTVINYSSLEKGCDLCVQRLSYKSIENYIKKFKAQNHKISFKNIYFQKSKQP